MITIKNMHYEMPKETWQVRVDRETVLGNPYILEEDSVRDEVILQYKEWLENHIEAKTHEIMTELNRIKKLHDDLGNIELFCWCAPLSCHSEVIRDKILDMK